MNNEERNLTIEPETVPVIPDENINAVVDLSGDVAIWCKPVRGGFQFANQDKIIPEIIGTIVDITPYLINFDEGDRLPAKKPHVASDLEIPEGYSRRCDIKVVAGGQVIGISLAPSSMKFQLSPYLKYLKNSGLRPEQVITRLTSKQVSNNLGTFQVVVFELVDTDQLQKEMPSEEPPVKGQEVPSEWA